MNDIKELKAAAARPLTLKDWAAHLVRSSADRAAALAELTELVWDDRAMMEELHRGAGFDLKHALSQLLASADAGAPAGADRDLNVKTTSKPLSAPASLAASQATMPEARQSLKPDAIGKAKRATATAMLLVIDNKPIGEWTIGLCRTRARRKDREARMLKAVLKRVGHLPHTTEVGAVLDDIELKAIASEIE